MKVVIFLCVAYKIHQYTALDIGLGVGGHTLVGPKQRLKHDTPKNSACVNMLNPVLGGIHRCLCFPSVLIQN